jgi:hypothetical protein
VHQVGLNDFGRQNYSFLAFKAEAVGEVQILRTVRRVTDGKFFFAEIMKNHEKS